MSSGNIQIGYNTVEDVANQVQTAKEEVETIFKRMDAIIEANVGKGTNFRGMTANAIQEEWQRIRPTFSNYTTKIEQICSSAQFANREYQNAEELGVANLVHLP